MFSLSDTDTQKIKWDRGTRIQNAHMGSWASIGASFLSMEIEPYLLAYNKKLDIDTKLKYRQDYRHSKFDNPTGTKHPQ